jgi:hypothetical protein
MLRIAFSSLFADTCDCLLLVLSSLTCLRTIVVWPVVKTAKIERKLSLERLSQGFSRTNILTSIRSINSIDIQSTFQVSSLNAAVNLGINTMLSR